jgi:hypothetical protein
MVYLVDNLFNFTVWRPRDKKKSSVYMYARMFLLLLRSVEIYLIAIATGMS